MRTLTTLIPILLTVCVGACVGTVPGTTVGGDDDDNPGSNMGSDPGSGSGSGGGGGGAAGRITIAGKNLVDDHGNAVRLTGINWFGLETPNYAPHGLWQRSMDEMLDQIVQLGFNTIRVPFCTQLFDAGTLPNGIDFSKNPDLVGKSGPEVLDALVTKATARGLRIILDRHRPDSAQQSPLWYTTQYSEQRWIADWVMLAQKYKNNPAVVAFDLHNEPHANATWGDGNMATDWRAAAERAGNAILAVDPDALIIVEGIETYGMNGYWWGGNLRGATMAPVTLTSPNHVIYSPHDYPASIYPQPWFSAPGYPANLPALWDATWGNLAQNAPVLVGEFGTKLQTEVDRQWLGAMVQYIRDRQLSFTYWSLNPNSGDTGGILADDWVTVQTEKMTALKPALGPLLPVQ
jgi:endoglucanase